MCMYNQVFARERERRPRRGQRTALGGGGLGGRAAAVPPIHRVSVTHPPFDALLPSEQGVAAKPSTPCCGARRARGTRRPA